MEGTMGLKRWQGMYKSLFDREVTAVASDSHRHNTCAIIPAPICFAYGCAYRVTVNSTVYELVADGYIGIPCIGNAYLEDTAYEDTGEDFFIYAVPGSGGGMYFTFLNEGTFNIKIEQRPGCENAIFFSWYGDYFYPNLPERNEEVYPYVGIFKKTAIATCKIAYASKTPFVYDGESFGIGSDTLKTTWTKVLNSMTSDWDGWSETGDTINETKLYWANHDVLNADGTVYLAASEPVPITAPIPILAPTIDPLSLWLGWRAGNWVARQRGRKAEEEKTPVAFLYNGVRLPDINAVWTDKETYPYASIIRVDAGLEQPGFDGEFYYTLDFADAAPIWDGSKTVWNGPAKLHTFLLTNSDKIATAVGMPIGQWFGGEKNNVGVNGNIAYFLPVTWASVDILNADGTVYLATSDPVPVYE